MISGAHTFPDDDQSATDGSASTPWLQEIRSSLWMVWTFIPLPLVAMPR